jgi:DNA polymerase III subunit epsilon
MDISDQEKSTEWAQSILEKDNWCILDTETTGLGGSAQIVQIGVITSSNLEGWQVYVKPTIPISEAASQIHGITDEDVKDALPFEVVFLDLWKLTKNGDLIIYNADFDTALIRQSLRARGYQIAFPTSDRRGCRIFTNGGSIYCAMEYYAQWVGEWSDYHGNYKWQKLPGGDHSALGDCRATLEVIKQMAGDDYALPNEVM